MNRSPDMQIFGYLDTPWDFDPIFGIFFWSLQLEINLTKWKCVKWSWRKLVCSLSISTLPTWELYLVAHVDFDLNAFDVPFLWAAWLNQLGNYNFPPSCLRWLEPFWCVALMLEAAWLDQLLNFHHWQLVNIDPVVTNACQDCQQQPLSAYSSSNSSSSWIFFGIFHHQQQDNKIHAGLQLCTFEETHFSFVNPISGKK